MFRKYLLEFYREINNSGYSVSTLLGLVGIKNLINNFSILSTLESILIKRNIYTKKSALIKAHDLISKLKTLPINLVNVEEIELNNIFI